MCKDLIELKNNKVYNPIKAKTRIDASTKTHVKNT